MSSRRKKLIIFIIADAVAVAIIVGIAVWMGAQQWNELTTTAKQQHEAAQQARDQVQQAPHRKDRIKLLKDMTVTDIQCDGAWWFGWQADVLPQARDQRQACVNARDKQQQIAKGAETLRRYVADETTVLAALEQLKIDQKAKNWQAKAQQSATEALERLKQETVSSEVEPVKDEAVKRVESIVTAWQALKKADKQQNQTSYEKSTKALQKAYKDIAEVATVSERAIQPVIAEFVRK